MPEPNWANKTVRAQDNLCVPRGMNSESVDLIYLEVDHIIARSNGSTDHLSNLQLVCGDHNRVKGIRGMEYLRTKLQLAA